ncbi:MAG TPA: ABC transporter ATP-binding protein [Thermotogota bacterium]|nr:ABC transporter ATP-binding protein [Thermotogota bacterium]
MKIFNQKLILTFIVLNLFSFVVILCNIMQPLISQKLLDLTLAGSYGELPVQFVLLSVAIVVLLVCELCRKMMAARYKKGILDGLRSAVLKGMLSKKLENFQLLNNQKYISLFNNDLREITEAYYVQFTDILFNFLSLAVYATALFRLNTIMALIVIATNVLPILAPLVFRRKLQLKKETYLESLKEYNVRLGDVVNGFAVIRVHQMKPLIENLLRKTSERSTDREKDYEILTGFSNMLVGLLSYANYFCIILAGVYLMIRGELSAGGLLATIQVSELLVGPTVSITYQMNVFNAIKTVKRKVFKTYGQGDISEEVMGRPEPIEKIEIRNLNFHYNEVPALQNINLCFEKGKKYLIYGQSGSGKSTLFKVLSKMNSTYTGEILVDGKTLSEVGETDYFSRIGIVYQTPFVFNDTLLNNITIFRKRDKKNVEKIIDELDLGRIKADILMGKVFKDSENNISGGEKQKIALARVLLEGKQFIFLDEASSSIDARSSFKIESDLLSKSEITLINIEHKVNPNTLPLYDEVICLEGGYVTEILRSDEEKHKLLKH